MRNTYPSAIGSSRKWQQRNVAVLALVLCLWLLAYATHLHARDDGGSATEPSAACSFCLSLPAGGAAPATHTLAAPVFIACAVAAISSAAIVIQDVPSYYRSRAPPAL